MYRSKLTTCVLAAVLALGVLAAIAPAKMTSTELGGKLCLTKGGGNFVNIPGFPGEKIDRRLLADINFLERRYDIFITDGYSTSAVHSANGEHPIGLALDIVPNPGDGWRKITRLAKWAEPHQNEVRSPFRWVGYDGDAGHGRGHHLHLSYAHSNTKPKHPANSVYTIQCPEAELGESEFGESRELGSLRELPKLAPAVPESAE